MDNVIKTKPLRSEITQTAYQVHSYIAENVIDFTEKKLMRYSMMVGSLESQKVLLLLNDYLANKVAVCWKDGKPLYILTQSR